MNYIHYLITTILSLLLGNPTDSKSTILNKKPTHEDNMKLLNQWIEKNFYIICLAVLIIVLITFIGVCFVVCGVSAVESGQYYNHLGGII